MVPRASERILALPALAVAAVLAAAPEPVAADATPDDVCPIQAPVGGFTSFVAWTAIFNAQPHHVAAPFKRDLVAPLMMPQLCTPSQWSTKNWAYLGTKGSDWMAKPISMPVMQLTEGGDQCSQTLSAIGVFTVIQSHAALRLHFAGCGRPASIIAFRLTNDTKPSTGTGEPTVMGINLLSWMCKVSPAQCKQAKAEARRAGSVAPLDNAQLAKGQVGMGKCTGYGVEPHEVTPSPASAADCAQVCRSRVAANLAGTSQESCRGYAWSERLQSCIVYDGWPVTGTTDQWSSDGYFCDNLTATAVVPPKASGSPGAPMDLDLSKVFDDPRAVTARRIEVQPFKPGCFPEFNWYIIDRWIHVPQQDFDVILKMSVTNRTEDKYLFSHPSDGGRAPRSNLVIQRACIRDCVGALRAECIPMGEGVPAPKGFAKTPDGRLTAVGRTSEGGTEEAGMSSTLAGVMGQSAADVFTDEQLLPYFAASAAGSLALGAVVSACLSGFWMKFIASRPKYRTVEEVKLIYEGEEEECVALRSTPGEDRGGIMSSLMGGGGPPGISSTWVPSKAPAATGFASMIGSQRSQRPLATWG